MKKLPEDYWVYYEPNINNRLPDFIVIAPDLGVIILEVKSWRLKDIRAADSNNITVRFKDKENTFKHPLRQAREYQWRLSDVCKNYPQTAALIQQEGQYKGKFIFPFCHYAVLSNISHDNIESIEDVDYYEIFRPENTIFRDQMLTLKDASPEKIRSEFKNLYYPFRLKEPLTNDQVKILRAIIHPQIIVDDLSPKTPADDNIDLRVLDERQEKNAQRIGDGHRIIYGVAGSGKTVLLIAHSKILQDRNPDARILLLCYNVSLCSYLKGCLKHYRTINVLHFDGWAKQNHVHRRTKDPNTNDVENDESLGKRFLEYLQKGRGDSRNFDAILVDEAQDFPSIWFSCILESLKDPENGDLLIVCDGNQGVRLISSVSWKSIGIKAAGRTIHQAFDLDRNYRNTREILKLAQHFAVKNLKNFEDSLSIVPVNPTQAMRRGPRPIIYSCKDHADECQKILHVIKRLIAGIVKFQDKPVKVQPGDIGILYHGIPKKERPVFEGFIQNLREITPVTWLNEDRDSRSKVFEHSLKVQTVYSAKGLQYRVVIVMWADQFTPRNGEDADHEARLLYVALTRASDILIVTYSSLTDLVEKMVGCGEMVEGK